MPATFRDFGTTRRIVGGGHSTMATSSRHRSRNPQKCCQNIWKPQPLPALFGQGGGRRKRNSTNLLGKGKKQPKLITVDVVADGLIVFTRDEGPSLEEKNRLMTLTNSSMPVAQCPNNNFQPFWAFSGIGFQFHLIHSISLFLALFPFFILALLIQRHFMQRRINALSTFSPSYPVEMSGFPTAFGQSPIPKPRHYGRL